MTLIYNTPKILHIQECDVDGNKYIIKYYREDIIHSFLNQIKKMINNIEEEANKPERSTK